MATKKARAKSAVACDHDHTVDVSSVEERLKAAGYKLTKPRQVLIKAIAHQAGPFTTEEIFRASRKSLRGVACDLVTVYRSLAKFEEMGVVARVDLGDGLVRYEVADGSGHHHHHFICRRCRRIEPLKNCEIRAQEQILKSAGYTDLSHRLEFFGLCPPCSKTAFSESEGRRI